VFPVVLVRPVRSMVYCVNAAAGFGIVSTGAPKPAPLFTETVTDVGPFAGLGLAIQNDICTAV
jgi:hypothetical protein